MKMIRSLSCLSLFLAAALGLSSCSSGFNQQWAAAMAKPIPAHSIEGPWQGTWLSKGNGHHGELRCVVGPESHGERTFFYHATWGGVFSGNFKAPHHVSQLGPTTAFTADSDLGSYGKFKAVGTIKDGEFKATYNAVGDHGEFEMKRPQK